MLLHDYVPHEFRCVEGFGIAHGYSKGDFGICGQKSK